MTSLVSSADAPFRRNDQGELTCDGVRLADIARDHGTPTYVYSAAAVDVAFDSVDSAYAGAPHLVCFALKACSNLALAARLARRGAGVDIVSGGELFRALKAGFPSERIVFAGVGKTRQEIGEALDANILLFTVESIQEVEAISALARERGKTARVAFRVNPDVDPKTHPYVSTGLKKNKFGIGRETVLDAYRFALSLPNLDPTGIHCHIGSQLVHLDPVRDAVDRIADLVAELKGIGVPIRYIDIGGGIAIRYRDETPDGPTAIASHVIGRAREFGATILMEPGRFLVGNAGILLTEVVYTKENGSKKFVVVDAAMNDLIRPSLYDAYHEIVTVSPPSGEENLVDIVGPVCESGDFLAHDRSFPPVASGDLLAVLSAGAYGFVMSSNYNARPRAAEVVVAGGTARVTRQRESYEDLIRGEVV
ncbi:MAG: diaminopimelate decarboxylase [Chloroflexota bacterium]|nr:MAG: diaminopimelate decarboxylase [Chloroflexota bacterium]